MRISSLIYRHPSSGIIYFRKVIPERYRQFFNGRVEFKRSLRTHDKSVALPSAMKLYSDLQEQFNSLENKVVDMVKPSHVVEKSLLQTRTVQRLKLTILSLKRNTKKSCWVVVLPLESLL